MQVVWPLSLSGSSAAGRSRSPATATGSSTLVGSRVPSGCLLRQSLKVLRPSRGPTSSQTDGGRCSSPGGELLMPMACVSAPCTPLYPFPLRSVSRGVRLSAVRCPPSPSSRVQGKFNYASASQLETFYGVSQSQLVIYNYAADASARHSNPECKIQARETKLNT